MCNEHKLVVPHVKIECCVV